MHMHMHTRMHTHMHTAEATAKKQVGPRGARPRPRARTARLPYTRPPCARPHDVALAPPPLARRR